MDFVIGMNLLSVGIMIGLGAVGVAIGMGLLGGKFLESSARHTERALAGEMIQEAEESIRVAAALASSDEAFKVLTAPAPTHLRGAAAPDPRAP